MKIEIYSLKRIEQKYTFNFCAFFDLNIYRKQSDFFQKTQQAMTNLNVKSNCIQIEEWIILVSEWNRYCRSVEEYEIEYSKIQEMKKGYF